MTRRFVRRISVLPLASVLLAGCAQADPGATVTPSPTASPSATASASANTPEPIPSDELSDYTCDFPILEDATTARANIVDVRVGEHADYDRVVLEFNTGTPELELAPAEPPFVQDASGLPIEVDGEAYLRLRMRGGTKQQEDGTSSYDGPTNFDPEFSQLVDLVEGGDFEAQSTWYLGLNAETCARVTLLTDPHRLVIDVEL
jgi:hypothetical protein